MYNYLDHPVGWLDEPRRFLLAAMRLWVTRARAGACPCAALSPAFAQRGQPQAVRDFGMAMAALDRDALGVLRFGASCCGTVSDDEARLLTLFDAGLAGRADDVRRLAARLVTQEAAPRLATAVEWVTLHLTGGQFEERDA